MELKTLWERYVGNVTPGEFMCRYQSRNPRRCAERYVSRLPDFLGVLRAATWRKTFLHADQLDRELVTAGLTAYLDETRPEWEAALGQRGERERVEREQTDWEQVERERNEREQAEWERSQQPPPAPEPETEAPVVEVVYVEPPAGDETPPAMPVEEGVAVAYAGSVPPPEAPPNEPVA
jgi:hypothetical protein